MEFRVNLYRDGQWEFSDPMPETDARAEAINQNGSEAAALESAGYSIRYVQMVLDGPAGDVAIVEVEPV